MSIPAAGLYTMETVAAPNTRLSNSMSCVKKPVFGRTEGRLDFRCANALLRGILSCFMRYARHREADRLTPDTQCTSVLPPADRTCITKHVLLVNGAVRTYCVYLQNAAVDVSAVQGPAVTGQAVLIHRNIEACSSNHGCRSKAISVTNPV